MLGGGEKRKVFLLNPASPNKSVHCLPSAGGQSGTDVDMACYSEGRDAILRVATRTLPVIAKGDRSYWGYLMPKRRLGG